jgi:carbamate kinase
MSKPLAIVAVGGNALIRDDQHDSIPDQYDAVVESARHIADMIEAGWDLVLTHGNGPQVGFILRRSELAADEVRPVPLDYAVGDTQGAIGYMFQKGVEQRAAAPGNSTARGHRRDADACQPRRSRVPQTGQTDRRFLR